MPMNPRLLVPRAPRATFDPDAASYLRAVEAADGQVLETPVKRAVDDFIKGCKADGIWDAIKASCILCGARTLAGALVPLVGTAPTNVADGFVEGDYTRGGATPGLKGDGTSYLDSGRANDADPQNDNHLAAYQSQQQSGVYNNRYFAGRQESASSYTLCGTGYFNKSAAGTQFGDPIGLGLHAVSRSSESEFTYVNASGTPQTVSETSVEVTSVNNFLLWTYTGSQFTDARLAFYSIGKSLDLALLDARVTALVTAIGAAV